VHAAWSRRVDATRERLLRATGSFVFRDWPRSLVRRRADVARWRADLGQAGQRALLERGRVTAALADRLRALSPRLVLERGYCLARSADGSVLRGVERLSIGDPITLEFARGEADARIEGVRPDTTHPA
jgi:exodeoxyribonuclease VII large subunit